MTARALLAGAISFGLGAWALLHLTEKTPGVTSSPIPHSQQTRAVAPPATGMGRDPSEMVAATDNTTRDQNTAPTSGSDEPFEQQFIAAQSIREARERFAALERILVQWSAHDPIAAATAVAGLPNTGEDGLIRERLTGIAARSFAQRSPRLAVDWALRFGYGVEWHTTLEAIAATDPRYALDLAATPPSERARHESLAVVAVAIADQDPAAAAMHWLRFGDVEEGVWAAAQIASRWHSRDSATAERWVLELPPGAARDAALASLQHRVASPVRATHLINAMQSDERRRLAAQEWIERLLQREEYVAAEALLQEVALTSEDRALLRQAARAVIGE